MGTQYVDPAHAIACDDAADILDGRDTIDDVQQQVYDGPAIPVRNVDPVAVQQLPTRASDPNNVSVTQTTAEKLCNDDPRRARLLISADVAIYIGTDQTATQGKKRAFRVPANTVVTLHSQESWYAVGDAASAVVSVIAEQWAR